MRILFRYLQAISAISLVLASCTATTTYWVPPSAATPPAALAYVQETGSVADILPPAATPEPTATEQMEQAAPTSTIEPPTPTPTIPVTPATVVAPVPNMDFILYYAQAADTLPVVAVRFGVTPEEIQEQTPDPLPESSFLTPGQLLIIPRRLVNATSPQHLLPDSELVYSPSAIDFDTQSYVAQAGGKLSEYHEWSKSLGTKSGAEVVQRVAIENSINPRLLLALLEYHSGWVRGQPATAPQEEFPMGKIDLSKKGLYNQLVWAVNQLSIGYYAWREGRLTEISFPDNVTARLHPELNAGTAALQYYFAQLYQGQQWLDALDPTTGFPAVYEAMFGSPWERALNVEPLFPAGIEQPPLILPFMRNWQWSFTGGPHGAWEHDGAYAALDFAPGTTKPGCVKSNAWATAAASGLVVRSGGGVVVLDLDGDGFEQTGWVLLYLHISSEQRIPVGSWVDVGDPLGHPSCEGGMSTGTHLHIARKYNGEWIPAAGPLPFNLGGWVAQPGEAAYKGTMVREDAFIRACTCSSPDTRLTRTENDP